VCVYEPMRPSSLGEFNLSRIIERVDEREMGRRRRLTD
jgi:hypothetical protein